MINSNIWCEYYAHLKIEMSLNVSWMWEDRLGLQLECCVEFEEETYTLCVIAQLDPNEGNIYNDPVNEDV